MDNGYFLARLAAERVAELRRVSMEAHIDAFAGTFAVRSRFRAWIGLQIAHAGARIAGVRVNLPRTARELRDIRCVEA